ncbi:MAG TPA: hypothetical protein VGG68_00065 [Caulobacteraceae bacterium]
MEEGGIVTMHPYYKKLARVLDRMGDIYALDDILARLGDGRMQSFARGNSFAVTEVASFPRRKVLDILLAVGDLDDCVRLHDDIVDFADAQSASLVRAYGRRGWMPWMADRGWRCLTKNFVYQKDM